jgi:hypothetical protein
VRLALLVVRCQITSFVLHTSRAMAYRGKPKQSSLCLSLCFALARIYSNTCWSRDLSGGEESRRRVPEGQIAAAHSRALF